MWPFFKLRILDLFWQSSVLKSVQVTSISLVALGKYIRHAKGHKISPGWIYLGYIATTCHLVYCASDTSFRCEVWASTLYTIHVSAPYRRDEKIVWFDLVLWHINHCGLFNAKSGFYIFIRYIWFVNINQQS